MSCYFERITKYKDSDIPMPKRKTKYSAAYDFCVAEDITIPSFVSSFIRILAKKLDSSNFVSRLGTMLTDLTNDLDFIKAIDDKDEKALYNILLPYCTKFDGELTIDLDTIKSIIKETNSKLTLVPTGMKCKLEDDQVLKLYIRSSCPLNSYLFLGNGVGIIDSDYYNNPTNEGHIFFQIINLSPFDIVIKKGDIIGQGEISRYCVTDNDEATGERIGGFGSTSK